MATAATPAPSAEPKPTPTPPAPTGHEDNPVWPTLMQGLGIAIGDVEAPKEEQPPVESDGPVVGNTISAALKIEAEQAELNGEPEPEKPEEAKLEPAAEPAPAPPADPNPPTAPPVQPVKVEQRPPLEKMVQQSIDKALEAQRKEVEAAAAQNKPEPAPIDPFEARLTDAEKRELQIARYAAKANPAKFAGYPDKLIGFLKKTEAYVDKARAEQPDRTFDESDEDFQRFIRQNRPAMHPSDRDDVKTQMLKEELTAELRKEQSKELDELRRKTHFLETQPKIEAAVRTYATETEKHIASDESSIASPIVKRASTEGWDAVLKEDQLFAPTVRNYMTRSTELAAEYEALVSQVKDFDSGNPDHAWLVDFVRSQAESFQRTGGDALVRGGKQFAPPTEYNRLPPDQKATRWTFSDRDVLERLAGNTKANIEVSLKAIEERLVKSGYERKKTTQTTQEIPKKETQPAGSAATAPAQQSPKATTSAAPGVAKTSSNTSRNQGEHILSVLGVPLTSK